MSNSSITKLPNFTLVRGSDWRIALPTTVTVDGSAIDYESVGYLQLQYRQIDDTGTPTRWKTSDGSSRYDSSSNSFLVPDDDAILAGTDDEFEYDIHYIDASSNPKLVGRGGRIYVADAVSGLPGV
jgi:hypothetical protein